MAAVPVYLSILFAIAFCSLIVQGDGPYTTQPEISIVTAPHHVIVEKKLPLLLNCSVNTSKDFGILEYNWRKNGEPLTEAILEHKIEILKNGSLYFRRIVHRKSRVNRRTDEGLYECIVGNDIKGRVVARRVLVEVAGIARNFTQEPLSMVANVGGSARFECSIQARPPAVIVWQKDNTQLTIPSNDDRLIQLPTGVLQILNVRESDVGKYRCMATQNFNSLPYEAGNIKWKFSKEAVLEVRPSAGPSKMPDQIKLLAAPKNTTAMDGETVVLECLADVDVVPKIQWRREDKQPLTDRAKMISGGSLRIQDVLPKDKGVYQCQVTIGSKSVHVSALLDVQTLPTMQTPPESNRWPVSRVVRLECNADGNPKPKITWYFNGTPITEAKIGRYELKNNRVDLFMYNVEVANTGYYQCVVENPIGQVIALAYIEVFANKEAPQAPRNLTVTAISSTALTLRWARVQSQLPILTYVIYISTPEDSKSEERQEFHPGKGLDGENHALNISELQPFTLYSIRVRAWNKQGASNLSEIVQGRTLEGVPRAAPTFRVSSRTAESLLVEWDEIPLKERGGVITKYLLQYRPAVQPSSIATHNIEGSKQSYLITGLTPNTTYELRLLAATKNGFAPPELERLWSWSLHTTLKANTSLQNPALKADVLNATALLLYWGLPGVTEHRNTITEIELKHLNSMSDPGMHIQVEPPSASYILSGLDNKSNYEVTVSTTGQDGTMTHTFHISEGLLLPLPQNIHSHQLSSTAIHLVWTPSVLLDDVDYEVCYMLLSIPADDVGKCVISQKPSVLISDLTPYTKYRFKVRINLQKQEGTFTIVIAQTSEDKPGPPVNLTYEVVKRGSVRLQWSPPSQPNGVITSYVIFYNIEGDVPDTMWKNLTKTGEQTVAQVDDLDFQRYFFKMSACTNAGRGNPSKVVVVYPDCEPSITCREKSSTSPAGFNLSDKQIGIVVGVSIGIACIIICIVVIVCRHRCFYLTNPPTIGHDESTPIYIGNGHAPGIHGNGHAHGTALSHPILYLEMTSLETVPMLSRLPENEQSDAKGGGDMIVTPNGVRLNGFVKTNGQISNGHVIFNQHDASDTSEERRGLIDAMIAATKDAHYDDVNDLTLIHRDTHADQEDDTLDKIDHSDAELDIVTDKSCYGDDDIVLAGNLQTCMQASIDAESDITSIPEVHVRTRTGDSLVHSENCKLQTYQVRSIQKPQMVCESAQQQVVASRNNTECSVSDNDTEHCHGEQQSLLSHALNCPDTQETELSQHSLHLRKQESSPLTVTDTSSLWQLPTSHHRSPGHRYLASDLPTPPPSPPPSPTPSLPLLPPLQSNESREELLGCESEEKGQDGEVEIRGGDS